jgi:hypothetical protein
VVAEDREGEEADREGEEEEVAARGVEGAVIFRLLLLSVLVRLHGC